jgi:mRNA interferase MazF
MKIPKRGDIWVVNLDPAVGSEIKKTRPAVIISNDINNKHANTVTVVPVTSVTDKIYPFEILIPAGESGLKQDSKAKANQIRTIDKQRLIRSVGFLSPVKISELENAIAVHLDMPGAG